jgi:alcohol dehydrogenase YqhD (iron-dependent ADH family)
MKRDAPARADARAFNAQLAAGNQDRWDRHRVQHALDR